MHATITRGGLLAAIAALLAPRLARAEDSTCDCVKTERSIANIEATLVRYVYEAGDRHAVIQQQMDSLGDRLASLQGEIGALATHIYDNSDKWTEQSASQTVVDDSQIVAAGSTVIKDGKIVERP